MYSVPEGFNAEFVRVIGSSEASQFNHDERVLWGCRLDFTPVKVRIEVLSLESDK